MDKSPTHQSDAVLDEVQQWCARLERAAKQVFCDREESSQLCELAEQLRLDVQNLTHRAGASTASIAIVGEVAEGKGWLARCFLAEHPNRHAVAAEIPSGQNSSDRSRNLIWFGASNGFPMTHPRERFVKLESSQLLDLGVPYVVGDSPGFSDRDPLADQLTHLAVNCAPIKILVGSFAHLDARVITEWLAQMEGAVVLPVIRYNPPATQPQSPDSELTKNVRNKIALWREAAAAVTFLEPIFMPDSDKYRGDAVQHMRDELQSRLRPLLANPLQLRANVERQVHEQVRATKRQAAELLTGFRNHLGHSVNHIHELESWLPDRLLRELLGDDILLHAGLRQRLRAAWMDATPSLCFPYRSLCGLLAITAGAWDRLIFSIMGSVPSLAVTLFQSAKNLKDAQTFLKQLQAGIARRIKRLAEGELRERVEDVYFILEQKYPGLSRSTRPRTECSVSFTGLEVTESESREIIRETVEHHRAGYFTVLAFALLGLVSFWSLIAGPAIALYRDYLEAWNSTVTSNNGTWQQFPTPTASMLSACFALSTAPVFLFAVIGMWWSCHRRRVQRMVTEIRRRHHEVIERRVRDGTLSMQLTDRRLEAVRFLLGAGMTEM